MSTGTILDIVILAVLAIGIIIGAVKGLFRSVLSVVIAAAAVALAIFCSGLLAKPATEFLYPKLGTGIQSFLENTMSKWDIAGFLSDTSDDAITVFLDYELDDEFFEEGAGKEIIAIAEKFGVSADAVKTPMRGALESIKNLIRDNLKDKPANGESISEIFKDEEVIKDSSGIIGRAVLQPVVRAALVIILFIIFRIVLFLVTRPLDKAIKDAPFLGTVNAVGGAALRLVITLVIIYVLVYVSSKFGLVTALGDKLSGSIILQLFLKFVP